MVKAGKILCLLFLGSACCAEQRFLDGAQNCAPAFWHGSVTRADGGTESVGAENTAAPTLSTETFLRFVVI